MYRLVSLPGARLFVADKHALEVEFRDGFNGISALMHVGGNADHLKGLTVLLPIKTRSPTGSTPFG